MRTFGSWKTRVLAASLVALALAFASLTLWHLKKPGAEPEGDLDVLLIRPSTENVIDVQQITVTFNKTMVPLGDYEKLAESFPITVTPKIDCQWRWLNGSTIACQLNQALPPSNAYEIKVPAGLKALDGSALKTGKSERFSTLLWEVVNKEVEWKGPDSPWVYVSFNQAMDLPSLQSNAESDCGKVLVTGVKESAAVELGVDPTRTYLFSYEHPIGIGKSCNLGVKGTTRSATGTVPSKPFLFPFSTYPEFKIAKVSCFDKTIEKPAEAKPIQLSGCNPDSGVTVQFTAPTTGENLAGRIKTDPEFGWTAGGEGSPEYFKQHPDDEVEAIYLRSPMLGASKHQVKLQGLKDRFGRALVGQDEIHIATGDFSPILQLPDGYGVIEKDGPHQLGFSGVNAKEVDLAFYQSHALSDVKMWSSSFFCEADQPAGANEFIFKSRLRQTVLPTDGQLNTPFSAPIDLSKIDPEFKYGMFVGKMQTARELSGSPFAARRVCSNFFTVVTDLGLLAKVGFYSSGIWVHSLKSGAPLKGIKTGLYNESGPIYEGTTDENGFLDVPGAQKWDPERSKYANGGGADHLYVVAESKDDFSVLPFEVGLRGLDAYEFNEASQLLKESTNHIVRAITDRPLYKPGQKVNVKVFARHWEPRTYGLRPAKEIQLDVQDALQKPVLSKTVKLSEFGTADFSFDLDASSPLGTYSIIAHADAYEGWSGQFDVQVFTLPVFKVKVEPKKESFEVGESANFQTLARYHFGGGVPNAKGEYTANFTPEYWRPKAPKWESFAFENVLDLNIVGYEKPRATQVKQIAQGEIKTDKNGDALAGILLPNDQLKSYGKLEYGVSFKDDRGKSIAGYSATEVFYSKFTVGIKTPKWAYGAKEEIVPEVIVLDHSEKPVAGASVELKLVHRDYKTVRRHGEGSYFYYDSRSKDREIATCTFKSATTPKGCGLTPVAAGDHYIVATVKDSRGRVTQTALQKYVTGAEYVGRNREASGEESVRGGGRAHHSRTIRNPQAVPEKADPGRGDHLDSLGLQGLRSGLLRRGPAHQGSGFRQAGGRGRSRKTVVQDGRHSARCDRPRHRAEGLGQPR
jgi:hypothetical protein